MVGHVCARCAQEPGEPRSVSQDKRIDGVASELFDVSLRNVKPQVEESMHGAASRTGDVLLER